MPDVSIFISAKDNFSSAIKAMQYNSKGFSKEVEDMQKRLDMVNRNKISLKVDTDKARNDLRALEKQFAATGDEADGLKMQMANESYENLRRNLGLLSKEAKDTEKAIINLSSASSKMENSGGSSSKVSELGKAMFAKNAGDALAQLGMTASNQAISSMYGDQMGNIMGSAISSAVSMAVTGGAMLGPLGALAGGLIGGGIGAVTGELQNKQKQDDAFRSVTQSKYDQVSQQQQNDLLAGTNIAAGREIDSIAFSKLYGSKSIGDQQLNWVKDTANETPFLYEDLKSLTKTLATYGYSPDESKERLRQIGDTGAALGMNTQDMAMVATGLGRMKSSDKATMEYLNLLVERGIPAIDYLAEAYKVSKGDIYTMISKSQIKGTDASEILANYMGEANEGAMAEQSKTFGGLSSTVEGFAQELQNAMGEGFVRERKAGLEEQIAWTSGEQGKKVMGGNKLIGQYKASLENDREQAVRDATDAAMKTSEYKNAINIASVEERRRAATGETEMSEKERKASAEAGRILMEAQVKAENEYKKSDGYQLYLETEKSMVDNLRADLSEGWENFGYSMSQEFTLGLERGKIDRLKLLNPEGYKHELMDTSSYLTGGNQSASATKPGSASSYLTGGYAFGLSHVPYDNFPAMLHQGERVLTASEARTADRDGNTLPITITGNQFTVREEADIDRIAAELARKLERASAIYGS